MFAARRRLTMALAILAIATLAAAVVFVHRLLTGDLRDAFGLSAVQVGLIFSLGSTPGLIVGPLADALGTRLLLLLGGIAGAAGLLILATASALPFAMAGAVLVVAFGVFTTGIVLRVLVAHWFLRWRGTMLGLLLLAPGLMSFFLNGVTFTGFGASWRVVAGVMSLAAVAIAVLAFAVVRSHPGVGQDETLPVDAAPRRRSPQWERRLPLAAYLRNRGVWAALIVLGIAVALVQGTRASLSIFLTAGILSPVETPIVGNPFSALGIGIVMGGLALGLAADILGYRRALLAGGAVAIMGLALLAIAPSTQAFVVVILFLVGFGTGGAGALVTLRFIDAVGVRLLGTLSTLFAIVPNVVSSFIPMFFGQMQDGGPLPPVLWSVSLGLFLLAGLVLALVAPFPNLNSVPAERPTTAALS